MLLVFRCVDPQGRYFELSLTGMTLELGLEAITVLVQEGWQLKQVLLQTNGRPAISLPLDAFDGQYLLRPLRQLEQQWKRILA